MERVKIKERVKGWRAWREYMGVVRQQNAMVVIFMHKKSVLERRRITLAWKDQVRWRICRVCIAATSPVTILQNRHCVAVQGTGRRAGARAANGPSQVLARHEKSRQIGAAACCGTASARRLTFSQTVWQRAEQLRRESAGARPGCNRLPRRFLLCPQPRHVGLLQASLDFQSST